MLSDTESVPISSTSLRAAISSREHGTIDSVFTFNNHQRLEMALIFLPRPSPPRPRKRCRAVTDIDGEHSSLQKKKRRLRLFLITSRLSPEFSSPATNIVDRGSSKIAVWAKQKALGRNLLRKAAILNRIRRRGHTPKENYEDLGRSLVEQEREQKQLELARLAFVYGSHDTHTRPVMQKDSPFPPITAVRVGDHFKLSGSPNAPSSVSSSSSSSPTPSPSSGEAETSTFQSPNDAYSSTPFRAQTPRRTYIPLPPSPLGLSNYDAFDLEDDPYAHFDDEDEDDQYDQDVGLHPASPSANTSSSFTSTVDTGPSEATRTPPQMIYSDFSILDPGEPVIGDYDQVDEGADAIWPSALGYAAASTDSSMSRLATCSPNFPAIFATAGNETGTVKEGEAGLVPPWSIASSVSDPRLDDEEGGQIGVTFVPFGT